MSSGAQVDLDWAGTELGDGGAGTSSTTPDAAGDAGRGAGARGTGGVAGYLTDEEILGIEPVGVPGRNGRGADEAGRDSSGRGGFRNEKGLEERRGNSGRADGDGSVSGEDAALGHKGAQAEAYATVAMPAWMAVVAADPKNGAEARALWSEHQEFRAAFSSPVEARAVAEEARAIKELLPGGVRDVVSLREATQSVERIDAALFSGDVRAQSEVVAEMARTNPAAFRSMFAEAAKVLAGMGMSLPNVVGSEDGVSALQDRRRDADATNAGTNLDSQITNRDSRDTNFQPPVTSHQSPQFDPAAYAAFERATNDTVARDVRGSIGDTLLRVMPEGVADGAAKRIGEDIFTEVHRALAADRTLSEQVAGVLRDRRFGLPEQQRVAALVAGRAKQLVPSVARRVIGEWTGTVLNTARSKAARQAAVASRVDIAAPGGSSDSMPLRAMSAREVNYASMSDEQILGM